MNSGASLHRVRVGHASHSLRRTDRRLSRKFATAAIYAAASLAAPARLLAGDPTLPTIGSTVFNVTAYGASSTSADNTAAIQAAINAAAANTVGGNGGIVEIPAAASPYLCNELTLASNVNLQVDTGATLQNKTPSNTFITSSGTTQNIEISGGGTLLNESDTDPTISNNNMVQLQNVTYLEVTGVTMKNASHEHLVVKNDSNVTINNISLLDGIQRANTDGIDYSGSTFLIENSTFNVGDDDIVAKQSTSNPMSTNIVIQGCTINAGHGISIGGQTDSGLNGLTVNNCTFNGTDNGIHLKASFGGGLVQNVTLSNLTMNNVTVPINVSSEYFGTGYPTGNPTDAVSILADDRLDSPSYTMWKNISFSNINVLGSSSDNIFAALASSPIQGLTLNNVNFQNPPANGMVFDNMIDVHVTGTSSLPIQCGNFESLEVSGNPAATPSLTQTYSAALEPFRSVTIPVNTVIVSTLTLGTNAGEAGTYNLSGSNSDPSLYSGTEYIGYHGTGTFNQTGGTNTCQVAYIGDAGGSHGQYTMNGGTLNVSVGIALNYNATLSVSNGAVVNTNAFFESANNTTTVQNSTFLVGGTLSNTGIDGLLQVEGASTFDVNNGTVIAGQGAIEMSGTPTVHYGNYEMQLVVDAGTTVTKAGNSTLTIGGPQTWRSGSELDLTGGTTYIRSDPGGNVNVVADGASTTVEFQFTNSGQTAYHVGILNLINGGHGLLQPSNGGPIHTLMTGAMTIDPSQLDLGDGVLIIDDPSNTDHGVSELAALAGYAAAGFNRGNWNGNGVMSSIAASDPNHATAIGILNNDAGGGTAFYQQFAGQSVDAQAMLARETFYGDGNLDGTTDLQDFNLYMEGLTGQAPATWEYGDYTYSGTVDVGTDFHLFAEGYLASGGDPTALSDAVASSAMTADQQALAQQIILNPGVPEPTSATLLAMAGFATLSRRRRQNRTPPTAALR